MADICLDIGWMCILGNSCNIYDSKKDNGI